MPRRRPPRPAPPAPARPDSRDPAIWPSCQTPRRRHRPASCPGHGSHRARARRSASCGRRTPAAPETGIRAAHPPASAPAGALPCGAPESPGNPRPAQARSPCRRQPSARRPVPARPCRRWHRACRCPPRQDLSNQRQQHTNMVARGNFRNDAAIDRMQVDLAVQRLRQQARSRCCKRRRRSRRSWFLCPERS